jgi:ribonucleoside-diphosphate reductase alpha chain
MTATTEQAWQTIDEYLTATRYAVRDPHSGRPLEKSFGEIVERRLIPKLRGLASPLATPERLDELAAALRARRLIAATPFLMSFGNPHTRRPGFFSCYPLGWVEDTLEDIEAMRRKMRTIYMSGGGAGIDLSHLRPKGAPVDAGQGIASGPVGFLPDFDAVTGTTNQGGRRRGALLVQLDWNHPDIVDFVESKNFNSKLNRFIQTLPAEERPAQGATLSNMNISVNAFGDFWQQRELIGLIAGNMWATGDPGLLFVDNMLKYSPLRAEDEPRFSNPCGEYLASAGSACNLITVNAARLAREVYNELAAEPGGPDWSDAPAWSGEFSRRFWARLARVSGLACLLGNLVLEFDEGYPLPEIRQKTQALKPVGVGLSGFHTALLLAFRGRVDYGSPAAQKFARATQAHLTLGTLNISAELADQTGHVYENRPYWAAHLRELAETLADSPAGEEMATQVDILTDWVEARGGFYNCLTTSQAPTGSVSVFLRNIDTGIEPFYALAQNRRVRDADRGWVEFTLRPVELEDLFARHPDFLERAEAQTALKLSPQEQLAMLAAFQYHCHTGVSKTINLPKEATVEDIESLIVESRERRLKGFTVYRDTSLEGVLSVADQPSEPAHHNPVPDIGGDRESRTFTAESANLTAHITLTHDERRNIREVFVSAGDVGASINSIFTALGMIISVGLREVPSLFERFVKVLCKVSMGERYIVRTRMCKTPLVGGSLPQIIGRLMMIRHEYLQKGGEPLDPPAERGGYDLCPECHELTMRREGSCRKCHRCGFSTC